MKQLWLLCLMFISLDVAAGIGSISDIQGNTVEINRNKTAISGKANTGVESMDTVSVGSKANVGITFVDNTKVKITENSRLILDDFVFDPKKSDAGKLGMRVALGTVRYASGQVAKNNPQNVSIKTPTATIAVRGTDFAMTVDEIGRSLVVLLPSCDDPKKINNFQIAGNCTIGVIDVITLAGVVTLTEAYTATYVTDAQQPPLPPVPVDPIAVGNDSNLKKPETIAKAEATRQEIKAKETDKSKVSAEEQKVAKDNNELKVNEKVSESNKETVIVAAKTSNELTTNVISPAASSKQEAAINPCWPFNECGNEKGMNWYYKKDENIGNTIMIRSGERTDNTTYNISVNSNEIGTKVVGSGTNNVTIRIWNR